jgi:ABC-type multidrug transport system fused ATPase/permease subunit
LDPFNQFSDDELWRVLERVHIKNKIQNLPQKLYTIVAESKHILFLAFSFILRSSCHFEVISKLIVWFLDGENFSVGEKQLLCLARALCRKYEQTPHQTIQMKIH